MAFENFTARQPMAPPKINWMPLIAGILFFALSGAIGYIYWYKNQTIESLSDNLHEKGAAALAVDSARENRLQKELEETRVKYEMLKLIDSQKDSSCINSSGAQSKEIEEKKIRIGFLLNKINLTQAELTEAKNLIASLKGDVSGYKKQVETLTNDKAILSNDKVSLIKENQSVAQQLDRYKTNYDSAVTVIKQKDDIIDVGSTLIAYNFNIISIAQKQNGKEKKTSTANKVDKLRISFDLGENRIAASGIKDVYVCITDPHGLPIAVEAYGSGKFETRNGQNKFFTQKVNINYEQGTRQTINFDWRQNTIFEPGNYKIEVYNNGFKIGEGVRTLKKGGPLSFS